jgi:hypothetical protein
MAAGVVSFIAHYLTLYSCYASIIAYLARFFCLSPVKLLLAIWVLAEYRSNFSRKINYLKTRDRPPIVPERLQFRNSKAFDWALTCVKQEGELRAIRVGFAQH